MTPERARLRYYIHDGSSMFRFKLSGPLAGQDALELEQCWRTALSVIGSKDFVVDVSELTTVDDAGRELLDLWRRHGAKFVAKSEQPLPAVDWIVDHSFRFFRVAAVPAALLLSLLIPSSVFGVEAGAPEPGIVLARYNASLERNDLDVADIKSSGDRTVWSQINLTADPEARALPSSAVAVSPSNYRFHFVGPIGAGPTRTYVFQITPRKKRAGLMKGELWIDVATGVGVRQTGQLVKQPATVLRRVEVTQDTYTREGRPYLRITRLAVETRRAGHAELTITEHPGAAVLASTLVSSN